MTYTLPTAAPLVVSYNERNEAKRLGAEPYYKDGKFVCWYVSANKDLMPFKRWWSDSIAQEYAKINIAVTSDTPIAQPSGLMSSYQPQEQVTPKGVSLSLLLGRVKAAIQKEIFSPVWTIFEVANTGNNSRANNSGHVYFEIVERDQNGTEKAKSRAAIWAGNRHILQKFEQTTGTHIQIGMKILALVEVNYSERFGLSLVIQDIDPAFTLGEAELQLQGLRSQLIKEALYSRNKQLKIPQIFQHIAVIAPKDAAGLGDFNTIANKLISAELCKFSFYHASFQGAKAVSEISAALVAIANHHVQKQFDAVVIIRGGGDKSGLNELNQYVIAKSICELPIPVIAGIGHERDNTIIDEIACVRCPTPSLVISHIFQVIWKFVEQTERNIKNIQYSLESMITRFDAQHQMYKQNIIHKTNSLITKQTYHINDLKRNIQVAQKNAIERYQLFLSSQNGKKLMALSSIINRTEAYLIKETIAINFNLLNEAGVKSIKNLNQNLVSTTKLIINNSELTNKHSTETTGHLIKNIQQKIGSWYQLQQISMLTNNPYAVLKRGYTLCLDHDGSVIKSAQQANEAKQFSIRFSDNQINVSTISSS